jgi:TonB family protein
MKCAEILLLIEDYSYNELNHKDSALVAAHLRDCSSCFEHYEIILGENEIFTDYGTNLDLEVSPNIWMNIQESTLEVTRLEESKPLSFSNLNSSNNIQLISLESQSIFQRLGNTILATSKDLIVNPKAFLQELFKEDSLSPRDKTYWQTGKTIAAVLWMFSLFSYASYVNFQVKTPTNFQEQESLKKIIDVSILSIPQNNNPQWVSKEASGKNTINKERETLLNPKNQKKNLSALPPNIEENKLITSSKFITNLPKSPSDLTIGNVNGVNGVNSISGIDSNSTNNGSNGNDSNDSNNGSIQKGGSAVSLQIRGSGSGGGVGNGNGTGPNALDNEIIYEANDNSLVPVRILSNEKPRYTEEARKERIEGKVILSVIFNKNGNLSDIKIYKSLGYGLDEEAISIASKIKFIPAIKNGVKVSVKARLEYTFSLF